MSPPPLSPCRSSHQVHQMHHGNVIGKWDWDVCGKILEIRAILGIASPWQPGENGARLLLVEHPPARPCCPMHCISVQLCSRSIRETRVPEPSTLKTRHQHTKQSAIQLSNYPHHQIHATQTQQPRTKSLRV